MITAISTVVGAIISGVVALIVSGRQHSKTIALIEYRLGQLETKVDKHNNLVERMYEAEKDIELLEQKIDEK
jgi:hypothetical protein